MPSHTKRMGYKFGRTDSSKKAIVTIEGDPIEILTAV
jgi:ribosomal protein L23